MKRGTIIAILVVLGVIAFLAPQASARMTISGTAPDIYVSGIIEPFRTVVDNDLQNYLDGEFATLINDLNTDDPLFTEDKDKLLKGFATANAYAAHSSDLLSFIDYDFMSISIGAILSAHAPSDLFDMDIEQELETKGDIEIGASAGATINVGLKAKFLGDKFLMNAKFGAYEFSGENETGEGSWSYETQTVGVGVSYKLTEGVGVGVAGWRGITLRSGLIYHKNKAEVEVDPDPETNPISYSSGIYNFDGTVTIDPSVRLGIEMTTYTIPLEVVTGVKILGFLNLGLGAGIDLGFGSSSLDAEAIGSADAELTCTNFPGVTVATTSPGTLTVSEDTPSGSPQFINLRLTASPGLSLGPVKIEVPATYYPTSGYSIGLTVAALF